MENYLILSNDIITINEKIKEILSKLNLTEENLIKFNMNEVYLETVMEELNTYGLFVTNKVVVMYSCDFLSGDKKRNMLSQNEKLLEEYIKNPNEVNSLIIVCEKLDERKKITKLLKERFIVIDENISIENKIKNNFFFYAFLIYSLLIVFCMLLFRLFLLVLITNVICIILLK